MTERQSIEQQPAVPSSSTEWNARSYDAISDPQARWGAKVMERLELSGDERVLDAGCGSGRVTELLLRRLPQGSVVALDGSKAMIDVARERLTSYGDRVSFVHLDLLDLTPQALGGQLVDAVFSTATFHWVTDHPHLFANLASILAPGGQLIAQCGGKGNLAGLLGIVRQFGNERAGQWEYASAETTRKRLSDAGFTEIETWLHDEPTAFASLSALEEFLETVCLRDHVANLSAEERASLIKSVAAAVPQATIDYVRLNINARKA